MRNLDLIDVSDNEFMMYELTSLDSSYSNCDEDEDLNTFFDAGMVANNSCCIASNLRRVRRNWKTFT